MKKISLFSLIIFTLCFLITGCSDSYSTNSELLSDTYEIMYPVKNSEDFWIGQINPGGELTEYGVFLDKGDNVYELVVNIGFGDTPHAVEYKNYIYYLKSNQLFSFAKSAPSKQISLKPEDIKYDNGGYALKSFISIDDDGITLEAEKWGVNENNDLVHIPTKITISLDGHKWSENL